MKTALAAVLLLAAATSGAEESFLSFPGEAPAAYQLAGAPVPQGRPVRALAPGWTARGRVRSTDRSRLRAGAEGYCHPAHRQYYGTFPVAGTLALEGPGGRRGRIEVAGRLELYVYPCTQGGTEPMAGSLALDGSALVDGVRVSLSLRKPLVRFDAPRRRPDFVEEKLREPARSDFVIELAPEDF